MPSTSVLVIFAPDVVVGEERDDTRSVSTTCCRALIVDDDPDMGFLTASMLEVANEGLVVAGIASSGAEAMALAPEADVFVVDYRMPERDGLAVAADLLEADPSRRIVLFSAYLAEDTVAAAAKVGVRECLSKERLKDLPGVIRRHCPSR